MANQLAATAKLMKHGRMKNKSSDMIYIRRRDKATDVPHGWQISLQRNGMAHQKFFSDSRWGGSEQALAIAKRYRDKLLLEYPPVLKRVSVARKRSDNATGHVGVHRVLKAGVYVWMARLGLPSGKSVTRSFAEKRHGRKLAKSLAIEARRELVEQYVQPDICNWKIHQSLPTPKSLPQAAFTPPPRLWVNVSVRAATPSLPKPTIMIRVADGIHGEIKRLICLRHHGLVGGKRRAIEILQAALIALIGVSKTADFMQEHAVKIKSLPKQGFRLNFLLDGKQGGKRASGL